MFFRGQLPFPSFHKTEQKLDVETVHALDGHFFLSFVFVPHMNKRKI